MTSNAWAPSLRSQFVTSRTYCRPKNDDGTVFEKTDEMVNRTISHQRQLWEAAKGQMQGLSRVPLNEKEEAELQELKEAIIAGEGSLAGRTMWLGGTDVANKFHASNFNCSYLEIKTVYDVVDAFHLLLLGCIHPDTEILDEHRNPVKVRDLKPNQKILTHDMDSGCSVPGYVLALRYSDRESKFEIGFSDGSLVRATDNHEFYLHNGKLVKAKNLSVGDLMASAELLTVTNINEIHDEERYIDITVGNHHNFILANGVITHNCGVGFTPSDGVLNGFPQPFKPVEGNLSGFRKKAEIQVIRSTRQDRGYEYNREELYRDSKNNYVWQLKVGDSGIAWAKAAGKILAMKHPVDKIILDFSEIRPGGKPLRGFGWISSGDAQISEAFEAICKILVARSDQLLSKIDILDIMNWLGTSLSSRRSAEIALMPAEDPEAELFTIAKKDYWTNGNKQRGQSNNSLVFYHKPTKRELRGIFSQMMAAGGSEPGFINGASAKKRAPWFAGVNPCLVGDTVVAVQIDGTPERMCMKDVVELVNKGTSIDVLSYCEDTRTLTWSKINKAWLTEKDAKIVKVSDTESGYSVICTPNHRIYTTNRGWVEAAQLKSDDKLVRTYDFLTGVEVTKESCPMVLVEELDYVEDVYDFEVEGTHSFFADGILVHNCGEILLGDKSFCNLVTMPLPRFNGRFDEMERVYRLFARANYRQTCVNLNDGVLQRTWHELNQFLRLTGVGAAGIVQWEHHNSPEHIKKLREWARNYSDSMADELNLPRSKAVTTIKPDGTVGKRLDVTEGIHRPLGKYIINNIIVSKASPIYRLVVDAHYRTMEHPFDKTSAIISLPVSYEGCTFDEVTLEDGSIVEVNMESAIDQLNRYRLWMKNYVDHNCSITVSYSPDEVEEIVEWLHKYWDDYVGVSWIYRVDPVKLAGDPKKIAESLGYPYLPQYPVTKKEFDEYTAQLLPVDLNVLGNISSLDEPEADCAGGTCPTR